MAGMKQNRKSPAPQFKASATKVLPLGSGSVRLVLPAQSLSDRAYEKIKHRIITCVFKPGECINEMAICNALEIGRTPIHQALDRLRLEGMVEVIPRKGVIVSPVSLNEVMDIIEARLLNESYCVRLAAERADASDIADLTRIIEQARECVISRNVEQMMLLDREFHITLTRAARNDALADILRRLHEHSLRFWFISLRASGQHKNVQGEHEALVRAIKAHNADAAERAMREHIESFRKNVASCI